MDLKPVQKQTTQHYPYILNQLIMNISGIIEKSEFPLLTLEMFLGYT